MFGLGGLAIVLIAVIVLFGAKKLPDLARSAGKSARILKSEARAVKAGGAAYEVKDEQPAAYPRPQPPGTPDAGPGGPVGRWIPDNPAPRVIKAEPGDVISSRAVMEPEGGAARH